MEGMLGIVPERSVVPYINWLIGSYLSFRLEKYDLKVLGLVRPLLVRFLFLVAVLSSVSERRKPPSPGLRPSTDDSQGEPAVLGW